MAGFVCISVGVSVEYVVYRVRSYVLVWRSVAGYICIYFLWDLCGIILCVIVFVSVAGYKRSVWYTCVSVRLLTLRAARVTVVGLSVCVSTLIQATKRHVSDNSGFRTTRA